MLDANIKAQLRAYLEKLVAPIELVASLDDSPKSAEMRALLEDIAGVSGKVSLRDDGAEARRPSFTVGRVGEPARIAFAGLPMGHEFSSLILALLQASGHAPRISDAQAEQIKSLSGPLRFETYISLSCHNCPDVVQALNTLAALNPNIRHVMIDGALNQAEVEARQIMAVPSVWLNGEPFDDGRMSLEEILGRLDSGAAAREAARLAEKDPFDVLVVGGGPAGLEAARVAAERGHRVVLAEASDRLGGQFRLAGMQPRRAQILDLIDWYGRQLERLRVDVQYGRLIEADDVEREGADEVVVATGSLPPDGAFQRALPQFDRIPGGGPALSAEAVMAREARPGRRVLVLDDGGNWKGCGTAWKLAEDGHDVTLVTPDPLVGKELQRMAADAPLRRTLAKLGARFVTESAIVHWDGGTARIVSLLDGREQRLDADTLVFAATNVAEDSLSLDLAARGIACTAIGDCTAPRQAAFAIHDGRKAALAL